MRALRRKSARWLRKWADRIDPRLSSSSVVSIRLDCDSSDFEMKLANLTKSLQQVIQLSNDAATFAKGKDS